MFAAKAWGWGSDLSTHIKAEYEYMPVTPTLSTVDRRTAGCQSSRTCKLRGQQEIMHQRVRWTATGHLMDALSGLGACL